MAYNKWFNDWEDLPTETTAITAGFLEHVETALDTQDDRIVTVESKLAGHVIADETSALAQRPTLNFTGSGVAVTDNSVNNRTDVTIGSGGSGHTIQDEGSALTARAGLNFLGSGVTATDDSANNRTNVTIPGATGGGDPVGWITLDTGSQATAGTAINNAIAALGSGGGRILIPAGTWTINTPVLINKNGLVIEGVSNLATQLIYAPGTVSTVFQMADTTQRFITIRDLLIDPSGASGGTAINASYCVNSSFERLRIGNGSTSPQRGIVFDALGTYYNTVRDCRIQVTGVGSVGLYYANNSNSNFAYNVRILGEVANSIGVDVVNIAHTNTFVHIDCEVNLAIGIRVGGYNTSLISCYLEGNTVGVQIESNVEAFLMLGGYLDNTSNVVDNGADNPVFIGVWRSFSTWSHLTPIPDIETSSYTVDRYDDGKTIEMTSSGSTTVTIPTHAAEDFFTGTTIHIVRAGTGSVTIA
ncbi:MAG: hypothetical protein ACRERD_16280, partial [Candidatus Binatia bacterium]